jgi:asparagine synthase (glutamine-hydrolysing)
MCGIVGIFSKTQVDKSIVETMNEAIIHRGPDSDGFYFNEKIGLAMRRLKIIDLSTGDQPIYNEDRSILIIFNGEIYNFQEIRELLSEKHLFRTKSDTEVILHGYEEWGIQGILQKLNGMFAFCIYDIKARKAFFARDRIGEKPFYYYADDMNFTFSSELRSLLMSRNVPVRISKAALYFYLALHYVPGDLCIIEKVKKLLPGYYMELNIDSLNFVEKPYWQLKEIDINGLDYEEAVSRVKALVTESIKMRMISDVPIGLFLSGGIDSSIIASVMSKYTKDLNTFSVGFDKEGFDETEYSSLVSKAYGTIHHHFIFNQDRVKDFLPIIIRYMDEPCGDQALLPVYWLCHEARKYVTVVLGGEGGDEVFAGYSYYPSNHSINDNNRHGFVSRVVSLYKKLVKMPDGHAPYDEFLYEEAVKTSSNFPLISDLNLRCRLIKDFNVKEIALNRNSFMWYRLFSSEARGIDDKLKLCQFSDIKSWLPDDLLMKYDKMAMANSLEGRAPYLDHRLVELGYSLPPEWKINLMNKKILRDAFKNELPEQVYKRSKMGFIMPMSEWLKNDLSNLLREVCQYDFDDGIDNESFKMVVEEHITGKAERGRLVYSLLVYRLWVKQLFTDSVY